MKKPELHLFILWSAARFSEKRILADIGEKFKILDVIELAWSHSSFSRNMTRFYGQNLPEGSFKEKHVGKDPFLLVIVKDLIPRYDWRETPGGLKWLNTRLFDSKNTYREWTGGGHKIHATNDQSEFSHDLALLLGEQAGKYLEQDARPDWDGCIRKLDRDLAGSDGWRSFEELFFVLDHTIPYVILRNFDALPEQWRSETHGDIDFLVTDLDGAVYIFNAEKIFQDHYRVHFRISINGRHVPIDLRYVGDNYYDEKWQKGILNSRRKFRNFYVPSQTDHFYSLLYHALVHKAAIAEDYSVRLHALAKHIGLNTGADVFYSIRAAFDILNTFLKENSYEIVKPDDLSVYFNVSAVMLQYCKTFHSGLKPFYRGWLCTVGATPFESQLFLVEDQGKKTVLKLASGHLSMREYYLLSILRSSVYFPVPQSLFIGRNFTLIEEEFIEGVSLHDYISTAVGLTEEDILVFAGHCLEILSELKHAGIQHRDIKADNLLIRDHMPVLIDFQWAVASDLPSITPEGLGAEGRCPSGVHDDIYSMGMLLKQLAPNCRRITPLIEAMTAPDPVNRISDIDLLKKILLEIAEKRTPSVLAHPSCGNRDYELWLIRKKACPAIWQNESGNWQTYPSVHIFLWDTEADSSVLADTFDSLSTQFYSNFKLSVVSPQPSVSRIFQDQEELTWIQTPDNFWDTVNQRIIEDKSDWLVFLRAGDCLHPQALASLANIVEKNPDSKFIYSDHDLLSGKERIFPHFKPYMSLDLLRSADFIERAFFVKKELFLTIGGFDSKLKSSETYDLILRVYDAVTEEESRHIEDILFSLREKEFVSPEETELKKIASKLAIQNHLNRNGLRARVVDGSQPGTYRCIYDYNNAPRVSIIIPTKNQVGLLKRCLTSLFQQTIYENYEIIVVDNESDDPDAIEYLKAVQETYSDKVTVLSYHKPFNYSEANNIASHYATGDYLLLLNNDTEIIQKNWLNILVSYCRRKEIGAVGARLLFPDGRIQHAGVVAGLGGSAEHVFIGCSLDESGYMNRLHVDQNYSAVTAACMLVKREAFDRVGGLDQENYQLNFSDVDFCLKLGRAGYKIVWTPHVTLVHHTSATQKKEAEDPEKAEKAGIQFEKDKKSLVDRWFGVLCRDPAYNYNLELDSRRFDIDTTEVPGWSPAIFSAPRIWAYPRAKDGAGEYRLRRPLLTMQEKGLALTHLAEQFLVPNALEKYRPDTLVFQTPLSDENIDYLKLIREYHKGLIIFEIDDLLSQIPYKNPAFENIGRKNMKKQISRALQYCDRMIVSTKPLAKAYSGMCKNVRIVPNYISSAAWGNLKTRANRKEKPRVGWAGSVFHYGDLLVIKDVVKELADRVEWIFMGMCPDEIRPYISEYHEGVAIDAYPAKLASLGLDLAVAPLEINPFNEAKSNLRILEYGILGIPVVATDIYPYRNAPVTLVKNRFKDWKRAIERRLADMDRMKAEGDELKKWILANWILEDHLEDILPAYIK
ncbi:MAG TPA: glycosyltransferase [Thermodesulfobacteriaceae bacterium]|nr:glycosyltransferase [Thermodesulfobacteriaceae bacterium]